MPTPPGKFQGRGRQEKCLNSQAGLSGTQVLVTWGGTRRRNLEVLNSWVIWVSCSKHTVGPLLLPSRGTTPGFAISGVLLGRHISPHLW